MTLDDQKIALELLKKWGYEVDLPKRLPNARYEPKENCFAYLNENYCKALTKMFCKHEKCNFYKPREEKNGE